jgi:hypothetical protein
MAISSFTLRKTLSEGGSSLRRSTVDDNGLRADGAFPTPATAYGQATFEANVYRRDEVVLSWELPSALVDTPGTSEFDPVELLIRGSNYGEPITAEDGFLVVSVNSLNYFEQTTDKFSKANPYIVAGNWCYYSLFIKYANNSGVSYYEKMTELSVQIPFDFGSTDALWRRIPTYYRELDKQYATNTNNYTLADGPLYRVIELFGW